jgi:hypothetical protein
VIVKVVRVMQVEDSDPFGVSRQAYGDSCQTSHACPEASAIFDGGSWVEMANDESLTETVHDQYSLGPAPAPTRVPVCDRACENWTSLLSLLCFDGGVLVVGILFEVLWLALKEVFGLVLESACGAWKMDDGSGSQRKAIYDGDLTLCYVLTTGAELFGGEISLVEGKRDGRGVFVPNLQRGESGR